MDVFTVPSPGDPTMGYAYLFMALMLAIAAFLVYRFKKAGKKTEKQKEPVVYEMYETKEEHEEKQKNETKNQKQDGPPA
ncbi:hypothetical protein [Alkalicoccus halolimnae]|jgi:amino acid permease|uniref:Uncharacterized protein n=1 Tax=Alkalicoccus halolimnae TaxID=1667239 RepID=A0A5C7FJW7_9BACI|nr:hypothetical protein [Alkalicoccus halolimnae]TXF86584.1 hypothetical protein FTX54_04980 [Alkalicoccus halolimnae]